ncbi:hypothetical protein [Odoribacter lunatus]|uniref:hypothetical protein n=1 Tax=Odoribacter lunatus TaxID=2941335 RepID=UPI002040A4CB|nr:hypothetical protein [Odoribacter lunatus]
MRKLLLLAGAILAFASCSKNDDELSIKGLEFPEVETPVKAGEPVTIKGEGFTEQSEIWLRAVTRAAAEEIKTEIVEVASTYIKFVAPDSVAGKQTIVLKQDGKERDLGTLTFEAATQTPDAKEQLYVAMTSEEEGADIVYAVIDGELEKVYTLAPGMFMWGAVTLGTKVYYNTEDLETEEQNALKYYDFSQGVETEIAKQWFDEGIAIGIIDGKLHGVKAKAGDAGTLLLVTIADDGTETLVAEFSEVLPAEEEFWEVDNIFEYDAATRTVILSGWFEKPNEPGELAVSIALNIEKRKSVSYLFKEGIYGEEIAYVMAGETLLRFVAQHEEYEQFKGTTVSEVDPLTLQDTKQIGTINYRVWWPVYFGKKVVFNDTEDTEHIRTLDPKTGEIGATLYTAEYDVELETLFVITQ